MISEQSTIKVMIVDDHPMVRDGLKLYLSVTPDMECVAEAGSGEEAVQLCASATPDVILMDMMLPGMNGAAATKKIRADFPQIQIIALTSFEQNDLVQQAVQAGAIGYLLKNVSMEKLSAAIHSAVSGQPTLSPEATRALMQATRTPQTPQIDLTEREREVLALIADGLTNDGISLRLHISASTVRYHVSNILSKLGATNRTEAARLAIEKNLLPRE